MADWFYSSTGAKRSRFSVTAGGRMTNYGRIRGRSRGTIFLHSGLYADPRRPLTKLTMKSTTATTSSK